MKEKKSYFFSKKEFNNNLVEHDKKGVLAENKWLKCAQFGIQGRSMPEGFNGQNLDIMTALLVMEGIGYGYRDSGLNFALNDQE